MERRCDAIFDWEELGALYEAAIPFAVDKAGISRDVDEVERGLACGCTCPACAGRVIARQGDVRIHHFAHEDRRECRQALEASIFGMMVRVLREPKGQLRLPPFGDRAELARELKAEFSATQRTKFFASKWVLESEVLSTHEAVVNAPSIERSSIETPDLWVPQRQIGIHLLSYCKRTKDLCERLQGVSGSVLGVDLRSYAALWWSACERDKEQTRQVALQAVGLMRRWLGEMVIGRGWLVNAEYNRRKEKLAGWLTRQREKKAEHLQAEQRRLIEEQETRRRKEASDPWRIPAEFPATVDPEDVRWQGTAQGLARMPPEMAKPVSVPASSISARRAAELELRWHSSRGTWFFVGLGSTLVPIPAREVLDLETPWEFVSRKDREQLLRPQFAPDPSQPATPVTVGAPDVRSFMRAEPADEIVRENVGTCVLCGAATNEVVLRSGPFEGHRAICCSAQKRHPIRMV